MPQDIPPSLVEKVAVLERKRAAFSRTSVPVRESLAQRLRIELTYSSNAIEGNSLSLRETQILVEEQLAPASMRHG